jgi:hypothetical protein
MADTATLLMLDHQVSFSEVIDMPQTIRLNAAARRMAQSMKNLFAHIANRDAKAQSSGKPSTIIFPPADTPLQDAIAVVQARLTAVLPASD